MYRLMLPFCYEAPPSQRRTQFPDDGCNVSWIPWTISCKSLPCGGNDYSRIVFQPYLSLQWRECHAGHLREYDWAQWNWKNDFECHHSHPKMALSCSIIAGEFLAQSLSLLLWPPSSSPHNPQGIYPMSCVNSPHRLSAVAKDRDRMKYSRVDKVRETELRLTRILTSHTRTQREGSRLVKGSEDWRAADQGCHKLLPDLVIPEKHVQVFVVPLLNPSSSCQSVVYRYHSYILAQNNLENPTIWQSDNNRRAIIVNDIEDLNYVDATGCGLFLIEKIGDE